MRTEKGIALFVLSLYDMLSTPYSPKKGYRNWSQLKRVREEGIDQMIYSHLCYILAEYTFICNEVISNDNKYEGA